MGKFKIFTLSKRLGVVIIVFLAITIIGVGSGIYLSQRTRNPFPVAISDSVTFPLYYPSKLPSGYHVDPSSFKGNNQAVLYSLVKANSPSIAISVQTKPSGFDFDDFKNKQLRGTKTVPTDAGDAVVGLYAERILGSLLTDKSWVLVNGSSKVSAKDIQTIVKSLREVKS